MNPRITSALDRLIVVMGSKGGVGTTTVAVNVGVQLATYARKHVALLDFASPLGNVHLLLDLHPKFTVRDAVDNLDRLDSHFFAGLMTRHKTKLEILGGATQPEEWQSDPDSDARSRRQRGSEQFRHGAGRYGHAVFVRVEPDSPHARA